ncbi:hypothetical protein Pyn_15086 [Prunus yedoensis var. nudiflora]|uniref:Uncharacterized protein n=1 Tax=Prunus yedoensis var. nudiflora TaxID=2094558 RepID=A0A314ZTF9_PRUYE|nr:hypothetical protein Pyn_15086 [Prunus yedoensis var. nudiflora]
MHLHFHKYWADLGKEGNGRRLVIIGLDSMVGFEVTIGKLGLGCWVHRAYLGGEREIGGGDVGESEEAAVDGGAI